MSTAKKIKSESNPTKIEITFDQKVADQLDVMSKHKGEDVSFIVNKAVKRFISQHKDYFPGGEKFSVE